VAAEYEVNIKINSQQIERQLEDIDKAISKIGKPKGGGSRGKSGISSLSPTREDLKASADYQKALQGVLKAGRDAEKVFGNLRKTAQSAMVAGANEARQLAAAAAGAPLKSQIRTRPQNVTRASADAAAKQLEAQIRASANLEKQMAEEVAAFEMRADKRVLEAGLNNDKIEFKQKIDDIVRTVDFSIQESKREGRAFDQELKRRDQVRQKTQRTRRKRLEGVGLGAGFPLLFGGGAGSVIGGGLGGLTGSFGAQIAFSAIGQQIDQFIASVANVGTALTSASGTVEMFREKNLFSSDAVKKHAFELEQQGEMQKLATLLTKDLASQIGVNAVKNFQELGGEVKEFLGTINQLFLAVQGFVAGPLAKLLGAINTVLGGVSTDVQFGSLRGSLTGEAAAQFEAIVAETRGTKALTGPARQRALKQGAPLTKEGRLTTAVKEAVLKDPRVAKLRQTLDVTGQTTLDDTLGGNTAVKTAQRLLESSQRRISILKLETEEIKKITDFKNKIAAAELVGDKRAVARLTRDQELAKLKSNEDKAIARINPKLTEAQKALEKTNIEARGLAQAAEIRAQFERDIAAIVKDEQNEAYKQQAKLLKANFDLQQKELKKAQDLAKSFGDTVKDGFVDSIKAAADETQRLSDALANMLNRLSDQLLNLAANLAFYGNAQGNLQQGQGLFGTLLGSVASIFNPFGSLMAPGGRYEGQSGPLAPTPPPLPALANGGIAMAGQAHIVGERGPELFVPRRTGTVVPNHAMGGANVTVNVDASGSSVEGNADQASQLGKAIGIAVQQELVKQKRPGGLLAR
jgi:hypothetical protein